MRERGSAIDLSSVPRGGRILVIGENAAGTEITIRLMSRNAESGMLDSFDCSLHEARAFLRDVSKLSVKRTALQPATSEPSEARA